MKATPAKTLRARPDSQRPPEQQLRPRFYDSPTTRFDGSSASSNSSIDLAPGIILRKKQTRLGQIDSLSTTPNVQPYSQQSKENSDLPRALTEEFPSVCTSHTAEDSSRAAQSKPRRYDLEAFMEGMGNRHLPSFAN